MAGGGATGSMKEVGLLTAEWNGPRPRPVRGGGLAVHNVGLQVSIDWILIVDNLRKYVAEFMVQCNRVSNWTPTEEYTVIFKRLPAYWL